MAHEVLGDQCKRYESAEGGRRATRGQPLLARLDGRAFHTFTRGLRRSYDDGFSRCMIETARTLVQETTALIGYTQSDEITLVWYEAVGSVRDYEFDGRFQKLASVLAGLASARFNQLVPALLPNKVGELPHFDCRVWQVPSLADALDVFVWREDDAIKNSITMAARACFTDRELHGKDSSAKLELLRSKRVEWSEYPAFFQRGTYLQRRTTERMLAPDELARIPEIHRPAPDATFARHAVVELDLPPIRRLANLHAVLFEGANPTPRA